MKKVYLSFLTFLCAISSIQAAIHTVTNSGNTFNPASITITEDDTINFTIGSGHNVIEVDQATYNANGNTSNGGFTLPFGGGMLMNLSPGTYYYVCSPHAGLGMKGIITVNAAPSGNEIWINEYHYDNVGSDVDEGVEVAGVAGTDLSCYTLYFYNGNGNSLYDSLPLTGNIDDEGCGFGAVWFPKSSIQNGAPDGIGLYNSCTSTTVQFISYEGMMTAGNGPFIGQASEEVPAEIGTALGLSIQLEGIGTNYNDFTWDTTAIAQSYDVLNPNQLLCGPPSDTVVFFSQVVDTTLEGVPSYNINLKLNQETTRDVTVDVNLLSGTASNLGNSFPETLTILAGNLNTTLSLTLIDDAIIEPNEDYQFIIENPISGLMLGSDSVFDLHVKDDDTPLPSYDIATIIGNSTDGVPDSLGVECKITGTVISTNYATGADENFFIHDGTSGIGVYMPSPQNPFFYTSSMGDSISISGTIGQYRGQAQIINPSVLIVHGTGSIQAPTTVNSPLDETTESELITLSNVEVLNPNDWGVNVSGGYNIEVSDGTHTYDVRIDADTDMFGTILPGCKLNITGVGSQFASSSSAPFTNGYRILPRMISDIVVVDTCQPPSIIDVNIADITTEDSDGIADSIGVKVRVRGTVNSPDRGYNALEFSIQDNGSGITVFTNDPAYDNLVVNVGDEVEIIGFVGQAVGVTQLVNIEDITILSSGNTLTELVSTNSNEQNESTLIRINNLTLVDPNEWAPSPTGGSGYNVRALDLNGDSIHIRIDRDYTQLYNSTPPATPTFDLIGVASQYDPSSPHTEGYQILPRFLSDVIENPISIKDLTLEGLMVYPIPATNILKLDFDYPLNSKATIKIINMLGANVYSSDISLLNGKNHFNINVAHLNKGAYSLKLTSIEGQKTISFIK